MCQLLGVNSAQPVDATGAFGALAPRGGHTDEHADGFGAAFSQGRFWRIFLDHQPSCSSPLAQWLQSHPIPSSNIIAHIRKATRGGVSMENVHPFSRELWGRQLVFAHNGTLDHFAPPLNGSVSPIGDTDSELAFCWILQTLRERFDRLPCEESIFEAVAELAEKARAFGRFNFLLGFDDSLIAHCSDRLQWAMSSGGAKTPSCLIATVPLDPELEWTPLEPGEMILFRKGAVISRRRAGSIPALPPEPLALPEAA